MNTKKIVLILVMLTAFFDESFGFSRQSNSKESAIISGASYYIYGKDAAGNHENATFYGTRSSI